MWILPSVKWQLENQRLALFAFNRDKMIYEGEGTVLARLSDQSKRDVLLIKLEPSIKQGGREYRLASLRGRDHWIDRLLHNDATGPPWLMSEVKLDPMRSPPKTLSGYLREEDLSPLQDLFIVQAYAIDDLAPRKHDVESMSRYNMARRLAAWCRSGFDIVLEFDEQSILRLDEAVSRAYPNPLPDDEVGKVVAAWSDYLEETVSRILKGDVITLPWDGTAVLVRAPSGWNKLVETGPRIWNRFKFGMSHSISDWWIRFKQDLEHS